MTKCFGMVTLEATLAEKALTRGMTLRALARRAYAVLSRSPELLADVPEAERLTSTDEVTKAWLAYWRRSPVEAWTHTKKGRHAWFRPDGDRIVLGLAVPADLEATLARLVAELVDYRLAQYRRRQAPCKGDERWADSTAPATRHGESPNDRCPSRP